MRLPAAPCQSRIRPLRSDPRHAVTATGADGLSLAGLGAVELGAVERGWAELGAVALGTAALGALGPGVPTP